MSNGMDYFEELQADADRYKHLYEIFKREADAERARAMAAEAELAEIREVLASWEIVSLPNDFPTIEIAKTRMETLNHRTKDGLGLIGKLEAAEARATAAEQALAAATETATDAVMRAGTLLQELDALVLAACRDGLQFGDARVTSEVSDSLQRLAAKGLVRYYDEGGIWFAIKGGKA